MMPERMGIIGKTQGVSDRPRPATKKKARMAQKPASFSVAGDHAALAALAGCGRSGGTRRGRRVGQADAEWLGLRRIADAGIGATLRGDLEIQRQRAELMRRPARRATVL